MMFPTEVGLLAEDGSVVIKIKGDDSPFQKVLGKIGSAVNTAVKASAAAVGAASAGVAALGTACINAYADYEQLVGGVETLFKDSADTIQTYADNAYKTAGLSANEYMETVTSFSASLLQSLDGDTEKAAAAADLAITDMADNANKMGTAMESIQNAYQGFAKQNYTMLDNLKLGYGGTKEEMQRLLADAEKLSGVKYDLSSYADIVEAIHVIQTEMGITGTTAKEASTTIQGSVAGMKAAWANLMVGMADDTQDFDLLLSNFIESIGTVADNLLPRIGVVIEGMGKLVAGLAPEIASALPTLTNELLPNLVELGVQSISALVQGIQENGDSLAAGALSIVGTLAEGIAALLPMVADTAASLAVSLADGLTESLPNIIPVAIETISTLVENLTENANTVIDAGIQIILALGEGLIAALPQLIETIPQIVINIANVINDNAPKLVDTALYLITRLATGLLAATPTILANIPKIIEAIVAAFMAFQWLNLGKQLIDGVANGVKKAGESMATAAKNAFSKFKSKITGSEVATELKNIGKYIIDGIVGGIKNSLSKIANIAGKIKDTLLSKLKGLFKIASPSKLMKEEVGAYIGEGIAVGIEESGQMAVDAAETVANGIIDAFAGTETAVAYAKKTAQKVGDVLERELTKQNAALQEMQKQADAQQAAEELADHKKQLAEKNAELNKAKKKDRQKILKEIAEIEDTWNKKQAKAEKAAEQQALQERISLLKQFQQKYEAALDTIERKQDSLQSKLADYGELFERVKTEDGKELFQLGDLKDDIKQLEKYGDALEQLKEKGISDSLMGEIAGMGVQDALDYMNKLISMSDTKFDQYVSLFEQKQQMAQGVAEKFYKGEFDALEKSYTGELPAFLAGVKAEISDVGAAVSESMQAVSAEGVSEGIAEQQPLVAEQAKQLTETAKEEIAGYQTDFKAVGESLMEGVAKGVRDGQSGVVNAVAKALQAAVRAAKKEMDINSPSRVMAKIGDYMAQGVGVGWSDRMDSVSDTISGSLSDRFSRRMSDAYEKMRAAMNQNMVRLRGDIAVQRGGDTSYITKTVNHTEGNTVLQIEHFHNDSKEAVPSLMQEMEFSRRRRAIAKGGA
nr:MAG TPA: tail tape measure protein [Caudoviricetes sp.]